MSDISAAVKIEDISPVKKKLTIDVPWAEVKSELDQAYREVAKTARIRGFRPGKIPRKILEIHYREQVEGETISNLVNKFYWETIQKNEIPVVTQPKIEQNGIEKEKDFNFLATIEVEPVVEAKDYLGLELEKEELVLTDEDVERRLQEIRQVFAVMEDLAEDRGIAEADFVTLDFSGYLDGKLLNELKSENYFLQIGSKTFVPGFEDQLLGLKKGEVKSFTVKFPESYHTEDLSGKDIEFNVLIKGIRIKKLPEIDEDFIKNFERYESLEALRADMRKNLEEEKRQKIATDFERSVSEKLIANNDFEVPESFIERQVYYMMSDTQRRMVSGGMDPKKAADFTSKLHDQLYGEAARIVKTILLLKSIAKKEAIIVSEEELEKQIRVIASQKSQDYETLKRSLEKDNMIENIRSKILSGKTYEFLERNAMVRSITKEKVGFLEEGK